ncbi:MAG: hypothetical protein ABI360_07860 [Allobranchiibius sp.]
MTTPDNPPLIDTAVTITGGTRSTEANYDDMLTSATLIGVGGHDANALNCDLVRLVAGLPAVGAVMSPGSAARVAAAAIALTVGPNGLYSLGLQMQTLAQGVRLSVQFYRAKDAAVAASISVLHFTVAVPHTGVVIATTLHLALAQTLVGFTIARVRDPVNPNVDPLDFFRKHFMGDMARHVQDDPSVVDDAMRAARLVAWRLFPAHEIGFEEQVAGILGIATSHGYLLDSKKLTVSDAGSRTPDPPYESSIGGLIKAEADTESAGDAGGSRLTIHHRVDAQGNGHWVVNVPGTADWGAKMPTNPSDATANLRSLSGSRSSLYPAINTALAAAMKKAGVTPGTQPVMMVGHSQGGIVAARLASNAQFRTRYNVTHLMTVAAPTSRISMPRSVQALSVEHRSDPVPRLDARSGPDADNRTNAFIDPRSQMAPGPSDLGAQHGGHLYAKTAAAHLGRDNTDPALRHWYDGTDGFMGGSDTQYSYDLRRPQPTLPQPWQPAGPP